MKINLIGHLVNVGKTNPNKPKVKIGKMNVTSFITMNYEQRTINDEKNKAKQTQTSTGRCRKKLVFQTLVFYKMQQMERCKSRPLRWCLLRNLGI